MKGFIPGLRLAKKAVACDEGGNLIEWVLVVALIALGTVTGMRAIANGVQTAFNQIGSNLANIFDDSNFGGGDGGSPAGGTGGGGTGAGPSHGSPAGGSGAAPSSGNGGGSTSAGGPGTGNQSGGIDNGDQGGTGNGASHQGSHSHTPSAGKSKL
jgi:Flp pilus assembly pilin Flp